MLFRWFVIIKVSYKIKIKIVFNSKLVYTTCLQNDGISLLFQHSPCGFMLLHRPPMERCNNVLNILWFWEVTPCRMVHRYQYQSLLLDCCAETGNILLQSSLLIYSPACHPPKTWKVHQHRCENVKTHTAHAFSYPFQINQPVVIILHRILRDT